MPDKKTKEPKKPARAPREEVEAELVDEDSLDIVNVDADGDESVAALPVLAKADATALTRHDPLAAYMRDVQRYAVLPAEAQHELAVKYTTTGDVEAAARLVTSNLRLVVKIAYEYRRAYKNLLDIIQEGNVGLMHAVRKYDPYKGVKLSSYAAWWIRAYILRFILNNHRLVKIGTTQAQRKIFFNLNKEKARLSAMGIDPTSDVIAKNLDVPEEEVVQMDRRLASGEASLDAPISNADGPSISRLELLPSLSTGADDALATGQISLMLHEKIEEFGKTLKGKEAIIFERRLIAEEPVTLQDLGNEFGVTRERVRQLEKRLQEKLKTYLRSELGEGLLDA